MLEQLRERVQDRWNDMAHNADDQEHGWNALRVVAAELLLLTGVGATLDVLSRTREAQRDRIPGRTGSTPIPLAAIWGPALVAPIAAAAHLRQAIRPSEDAERASAVLDVAVIGLGVAELVTSLTGFRSRGRPPSLVPLALASAGVLGLVVAHQERETEREHRRLEQRANLLERLVPQRRPKLDRIVVHV
jgi:hypothetical protein